MRRNELAHGLVPIFPSSIYFYEEFHYSLFVFHFIAAKMAARAVNRNDTILKDYSLSLLAYDGQCRADMVMKSFIEYIRK